MTLKINRNEVTSVVVTVTELLTEPTTDFDWEFRHTQTNEVVSGQFENLSSSPESYDKFDIDLEFPYNGEYEYTVKQPSNGKVLEVGMAIVYGEVVPTSTFENDYTFKLYEE